jgi:hypothetical protein
MGFRTFVGEKYASLIGFCYPVHTICHTVETICYPINNIRIQYDAEKKFRTIFQTPDSVCSSFFPAVCLQDFMEFTLTYSRITAFTA